MLIRSDRHKQADLMLWERCRAADESWAQMGRQRVERATDAIVSFGGHGAYCGVSWGKDSVVVAHLLSKTLPGVVLVNLRCTNRNPDCDAVRDNYLRTHPEQRYEEIGVDYSGLHRALGVNDLNAETDRRWQEGFSAAEKKHGCRYFSGIRKGESTGRFLRTCRWGECTVNTCAPIAHWTVRDVFAYLEIEGLPVHPAYAMLGGGRWAREKIRVAEIGDTHGTGGGRMEWEQEYYGKELRRIEAGLLCRHCNSVAARLLQPSNFPSIVELQQRGDTCEKAQQSVG